jgi:hypothetical protein
MTHVAGRVPGGRVALLLAGLVMALAVAWPAAAAASPVPLGVAAPDGHAGC